MTDKRFFVLARRSVWGLWLLQVPLLASPQSLVDQIIASRSGVSEYSLPSDRLPGSVGNPNETLDPNFEDLARLRDPYTMPTGALGSWGVGNGGDWLRLGFAKAREHASNIVARIKPSALRDLKDSELASWILQNRSALAGDILASKHVWEQQAEATCAWTLRPAEGEPIPTSYPIQFSYPTCRDSGMSFYQVTHLLIHESVHHFNGDEDLADRVALAVVDAWRNGRIDWLPVSSENAPSPRQHHSAVWTGDHMIVFGGADNVDVFADAASYDPATNSWQTLTEFDGQKARYMQEALWAEDKMIVWGGFTRPSPNTAVWDYSGFVWQEGRIESFQAPESWDPVAYTHLLDPLQKAVWTGEKLFVWGGLDRNGTPLGGLYDPKTKTWDDSMRFDAYAPVKAGGHSLSWTGSKFILWGGYGSSGEYDYYPDNSGAIFDPNAPVGQRWQPMSMTGAPSPRAGHGAVWTGTQLVVFGGGGPGSSSDIAGSGGTYDLATQQWVSLRSEMVIDRIGHTATWNGHEMLIFGGRSKRLLTYLGQVFAFDPGSSRWTGINSAFDPGPRMGHSAVWTGSSLIVWGGYTNNRYGPVDQRNTYLADGGIFYP